MARPGQIDHVAVGQAQLPEKLRADQVMRYLAVYLQRFNTIEEVLQQVQDAFFSWNAKGNEKDVIVETLGALFDFPRPEGFNNTQYAFFIGARVLSRLSNGTQADVLRVAKYLAQGSPVQIFRVVPKALVVVFTDLQATDAEREIYAQLLLDSVDAVAQLSVTSVPSGTSFYDVGLYDSELYAS